jgi:replication fork protection complex subunit Csm3/Swi3
MKPEDPDLGNADTTGVIDLTSDIEPEASSPSRAQQIRPSKVPSSPTTDADADVNMDLDVHSRPPSSSTEVDDDDFDIDALIKDEEERLAKMRAASSASASTSSPSVATAPVISVPQTAKATSRDTGADDDEEAMWDELNGLGDESIPPPPPPPPAMPTSVPHDEDEDMWDVVREMDAGIDDVQQRPYVPPPPPTPPPPVVEEIHVSQPEPQSENAPSSANVIASGHSNAVDEDADKAEDKEKEEKRPTNDEDWEDMYL